MKEERILCSRDLDEMVRHLPDLSANFQALTLAWDSPRLNLRHWQVLLTVHLFPRTKGQVQQTGTGPANLRESVSY